MPSKSKRLQKAPSSATYRGFVRKDPYIRRTNPLAPYMTDSSGHLIPPPKHPVASPSPASTAPSVQTEEGSTGSEPPEPMDSHCQRSSPLLVDRAATGVAKISSSVAESAASSGSSNGTEPLTPSSSQHDHPLQISSALISESSPSASPTTPPDPPTSLPSINSSITRLASSKKDSNRVRENQVSQECHNSNCKFQHSNRAMIQCTLCLKWYHCICEKASAKISENVSKYECEKCRFPLPTGNPQPTDTNYPEDIALALNTLKCKTVLYKRLPKAVRSSLAGLLSDRLESVISSPSPLSWWKLLSFSFQFLRKSQTKASKGQKPPTSADVIRSNIALEETVNLLEGLTVSPTAKNAEVNNKISPRNGASSNQNIDPDKLSASIKSKVADGDIKSALRLLTSNDRFMAPSPSTVQALQSKHPAAPQGNGIVPQVAPLSALSVSEELVLSSIKSMPSGSGAGPDGIRPVLIQELLSKHSNENGAKLLKNLTSLVNMILAGNIPDYIVPALFGASLIALEKEEGGVRPIAVGNFIRRLTCRIASHHASNLLSSKLGPTQLGVGIQGGAESAVHAVRLYASALGLSSSQTVQLMLL